MAAGAADHLRLPVAVTRVLWLALVAAGGAGLVGYVLLWVLVPVQGERAPGERSPGESGRGFTDLLTRWSPAGGAGAQLVVGAVLLGAGVQLVLQRGGLDVPSELLPPVFAGLAGAAVAWGCLAPQTRTALLDQVGGGTPDGTRRVALGMALVAAGLVLLAFGGGQAQALGPAAVAALAVLVGVALVVAPWVLRLVRDLAAERTARLREAERAEVAAHLHDSVLQTLSLLQRHSNDPATVALLARRQERELRDWLYGGSSRPGVETGASLADRVRGEAADVEDAVGVPVEVVVVGDRPVGRSEEALVAALREAVLNAVRHGRPPVQVYLEAGPDGAEAFVRDHGDGFDVTAVPADRRGVRDSVLGRMARVGGSAHVGPAPGGGTEVSLRTGAGPGPGAGPDVEQDGGAR
ncbi:phage shock protein C (PspC) family protein [Quadrisphaera granulorum]|uniref:Phage shock protein C (PspC) family protein n=1 Tax=Quadrisphaera granulorum TaxID=317664 RepID=A0A316A6V4_9ACTN|nr:phage shock protein C (PspC) family protein [Quadrisphaera granulorum]SZE97532.1 phage shock protein C (PspC) family protein [Quadrisphaera granulorum]